MSGFIVLAVDRQPRTDRVRLPLAYVVCDCERFVQYLARYRDHGEFRGNCGKRVKPGDGTDAAIQDCGVWMWAGQHGIMPLFCEVVFSAERFRMEIDGDDDPPITTEWFSVGDVIRLAPGPLKTAYHGEVGTTFLAAATVYMASYRDRIIEWAML